MGGNNPILLPEPHMLSGRDTCGSWEATRLRESAGSLNSSSSSQISLSLCWGYPIFESPYTWDVNSTPLTKVWMQPKPKP